MSAWNPSVITEASMARAGLVSGSFLTAGTGTDPAPSSFEGAVRAVKILVTAGAVEFYRVTLSVFCKGTYVAGADAELLADTDDLNAMVGDQVAAPALAITARQFDVTIRNAGVADVSTGRKISLRIISKQV